MWWPALGALVVGIVGVIEPRVLGVGYQYIEQITDGTIAGRALVLLIVLKFIAWSIYLGSGTSGGTLAPLFIIGGGFGAAFGALLQYLLPGLGVQTPVAAIVGMAAIFAGASHALLASVIFAFETTRQPMGLLPLLAGCSAAYLVSVLLSPHSIMTEKLARRGKRVTTQYTADHLSQVRVAEAATRSVVFFFGDDLLDARRAELRAGRLTHQGFPVLNGAGEIIGVITRRDLFDEEPANDRRVRDVIKRPAAVVFEDNTLREAADHMIREGVGRLPVVDRAMPTRVTGISAGRARAPPGRRDRSRGGETRPAP
jgi:CBS domain-containing protein